MDGTLAPLAASRGYHRDWEETTMRTLLLVVLLALWPMSARAEELHPNALEVGASVATCMTEARIYPPDGGVELRGNIHEATLFEHGGAFVTLHRRAFNPIEEPEMANQPIQPPMAFDVTAGDDSVSRRETLRYALDCFDRVVFP
jgi:hypothetical protein